MEDFKKAADILVAILHAVVNLLNNLNQGKAAGIVDEVGKNVSEVADIITEEA